MALTETTILDGSDDVTVSTVAFTVFGNAAALRGINVGTDIPLETEIAGSWEPVRDIDGNAVVLSATGMNPIGVYAPGVYRLNAGRDLAADEIVVLSQ